MEIKIFSGEWEEAWRASQEAERDKIITHQQSLQYKFERLVSYMCQPDPPRTLIIRKSPCEEYCFLFTLYRHDDTEYLHGGIIFHGLPNQGYLINSSIQITPEYGWQIHT